MLKKDFSTNFIKSKGRLYKEEEDVKATGADEPQQPREGSAFEPPPKRKKSDNPLMQMD